MASRFEGGGAVDRVLAAEVCLEVLEVALGEKPLSLADVVDEVTFGSWDCPQYRPPVEASGDSKRDWRSPPRQEYGPDQMSETDGMS
jgi:hypothetical protein